MSRRDPVQLPVTIPEHVCVMPRWYPRAILALFAVCLLLIAGLSIGAVYVYQQQQYVEGRGEARDRENQRTNERINDAICDLLDQLPEGGLLERPRQKYGCGPGIPLEDLPADLRTQIEGSRQPPPMGSPAQANPPKRTPYVPPPDADPDLPATNPDSPLPPVTKPPPSPNPDGRPLGPVTDTVCDLIDICLSPTDVAD